MTDLLIIFILIGLGLYGAKVHYQVKKEITPQRTPESGIDALADLLKRSAETGSVVELSSGYGDLVLGLSKRLPDWDITGIEHSFTHWVISNLRTIGRNTINYRFFWKDPVTFDLEDFTVVFVNQEDRVLKRWESSFARRLQPGTLLITYNRPLPRAKAIDTIAVDRHNTFYLYKKAASQQRPAPPPLPLNTIYDAGTPDMMGEEEVAQQHDNPQV